MSLIHQIKRAGINHGVYKGNVDDNWEPADRLMFHRLCMQFHGNYTDYPTRDNQSAEFLEWLDKYKDLEYSEEPYVHKVLNPGGVDLRQFIPDKQPVNTEGAATKQEVKARDAMVNENHIKVNLNTQQPKRDPVPDPRKVVEEENDLQNQASLRSNSESGNETDSKSGEQSKPNDGQGESKDLGSSTENRQDVGNKANDAGTSSESPSPAKPVGSSKPAPFVNKPAPFVNKPTTIKTR